LAAVRLLCKTVAAFAAVALCAGSAPAAEAHRLDRASAWLVAQASAQDLGDVVLCARLGPHRVDCAESYPNIDADTGDHCAVVYVLRLERTGRLSTSSYNCPTSDPPFTPERDVLAKPPGGLRYVPLTPVTFGDTNARLLTDHDYAHSIPTPYGRARWLGLHPNPPLDEWSGFISAGRQPLVLHAFRRTFVPPSWVGIEFPCGRDSDLSETFSLGWVRIRRDGRFSTKEAVRDWTNEPFEWFSLRGRLSPDGRRMSGTVRFRERVGGGRVCAMRSTWSARRTAPTS
jgi:hypothetical protein